MINMLYAFVQSLRSTMKFEITILKWTEIESLNNTEQHWKSESWKSNGMEARLKPVYIEKHVLNEGF